jgi:hypothetical protein
MIQVPTSFSGGVPDSDVALPLTFPQAAHFQCDESICYQPPALDSEIPLSLNGRLLDTVCTYLAPTPSGSNSGSSMTRLEMPCVPTHPTPIRSRLRDKASSETRLVLFRVHFGRKARTPAGSRLEMISARSRNHEFGVSKCNLAKQTTPLPESQSDHVLHH